MRQNMPGPTAPWAVIGALSEGVGWATDALQLVGRAHHAGAVPPGLRTRDLPSTRLQHEHTLALLQARPMQLAAGGTVTTGFFGAYRRDHPKVMSGLDAAIVDQVMDQPEARPPAASSPAAVPLTTGHVRPKQTGEGHVVTSSLFSSAPVLACTPLDDDPLARLTDDTRQHAERDGQTLLSYFTGNGTQVVTSAKQRAVLRPHGHIMRTGAALVPDEGALTTTAWIAGTFHSQVTQGHVSLNRMLSTRRSYLGLRQAQGLRVLVRPPANAASWSLLDEPSAWEVGLDSRRWWYHYQGGLVEVVSTAPTQSHQLGLAIRVLDGLPVALLICANVALDGDDGQKTDPPLLEHDGSGVTVRPLPGSLAHARFPAGSFRFSWEPGSIDWVSRDEPSFWTGPAAICRGSPCARRRPPTCI